MATWQNSLDGALRLCGRLASGESPTTTENTDYLQVVKEFVSHLSALVGPIAFETLDALTWTGGQASRTIGASGNFNTARPVKVLLGQFRDSSGFDFPPLTLITHLEYQAIVGDKALASGIPLYLAYNPTIASSLGTLFVWPVPPSDWSFRLTSLKPITAPAALSETITMPDGWEEMIRYNLAPRVAAENGAILSPYVYEHAQETLMAVMPDRTQSMQMDPMAPGAPDVADDIDLWTRT